MLSTVLIFIIGLITISYNWKCNRKFIIIILLQCIGSVFSLTNYYNYLMELASGSPAKWLLTPYVICCLIGLALIVFFKMRNKTRTF